ncbi:MAG TPA: hypothetical protein ENH97_00255 [bacterium]|nr:hypothetical protein [bacterium]
MKKILVILMLVSMIGFATSIYVVAQEENVDAACAELAGELRQKGVSRRNVKAIEGPVKNMLRKGATKKDIKDAVGDLSAGGIRGKALRQSVEAMNELVEDGENPKVAGNIVSRAAHRAQAQGLKGKDLAAKVREAVQQRKQEREKQRQRKREERRKKLQKQKELKQQEEKSRQEKSRKQKRSRPWRKRR